MATTPLPAADRLDEVAELLAEGILRARLRHFRPTRRRPRSERNPLELCPPSSAHASNPSREGDGERV